MKRVLAITALLFASVAGLAAPASASTLCVNADLNINGTDTPISQCV